MADAPTDPAGLTSAGFQALRGGDATAARDHFQHATATGKAGPDTWLGLSLAHRSLGSAAAEAAALDRALELDPRNIPALIRKGDLYTARSDARAATTFYRAALKIAGSQRSLAPEWRAELDRIAACVQGNSRAFEQHLVSDLRASGLGQPGTQRFGRALDLLLGRRQIYLQQPQVFYFPELPQIEFHDRADFPWTAALEQDTPAIREELCAILRAGDRFAPYMQPSPDRPAFDNNGLLNDPSWSACHLIHNGEEVAANAALCPVTMNALRRLPLCRIPGRTPTALFSLLRPGTHIPPHNGFINTRLICHLPLIVPEGCALRVGNETRAWREGEVVIFDDSMEHEAWNKSPELRVVLLFDVWRPELTDTERALVAGMLESIDRFGGPRREWSQ